MAVKYRIEYTSVNGDDYVCDISNPDYTDPVINIDGKVVYALNSVEDHSYPIRSKVLNLTLIATLAEPLEDLLTQPERYWRVELFQNTNKIFFGYLTSENTPNDFTKDTWEIELDALDPLAFLEDLSYVDLAGAKYNGEEQLAKIIANCLKRGFEDQTEAFNILSYEYYDYQTSTTQYTGGRLLKDTTIFQDAFIDEDSGESEGCLDVLKKVLNGLQLTVTQINGDTWLLEHYLFSRLLVTPPYINSYDKDGNDITDLPEVPFSPLQIKTDSISLAPTDILHAKENQTFYYKRGYDKLVVDNEYVYRTTLLDNPTFDGGVNGVSMPGWSAGGDYSEATDAGYLKVFRYDSSVNSNALASISSKLVQVVKDQVFKVKMTAQANYDLANLKWNLKYESDLGSIYRLGIGLNSEFEFETKWVLEPSSQVANRSFSVSNGVLTEFEMQLPPIPSTSPGALQMEIYAALPNTNSNITDFVELHSCDLEGVNDNVTGKSRALEADTLSGIKSDKDETYIATNEGEVLQNQLFKLSLGDAIVSIKDKIRDNTAYYPIGRIYAWNRLAHFRQKKVFSGGFWNFFEPHKIIQIPDLDSSNYRVIEYSFDTYSNEGEVMLEERTTTDIAHSHTETKIYANTIKPKIE